MLGYIKPGKQAQGLSSSASRSTHTACAGSRCDEGRALATGWRVGPEPWSQARQHSRPAQAGSEGTWQTGKGAQRTQQANTEGETEAAARQWERRGQAWPQYGAASLWGPRSNKGEGHSCPAGRWGLPVSSNQVQSVSHTSRWRVGASVWLAILFTSQDLWKSAEASDSYIERLQMQPEAAWLNKKWQLPLLKIFPLLAMRTWKSIKRDRFLWFCLCSVPKCQSPWVEEVSDTIG